MEKKTKSFQVPVKILIMTLLCLLVIAGGVAGMKKMVNDKQSPVKKPSKKIGLSVQTIPIVKQDVSAGITGYGQIEPVEIVSVCPEVSGKIIKTTALKVGEITVKGVPLFIIDDTDYRIAKSQAEILVKLKQNKLDQLKVSYQKDKDRLKNIKQNTNLSQTNWLRLKNLYEDNNIGTLSSVETAERSYNSLLDTERNLIKSLELYPLQIDEAKINLTDADSNLETARLNVMRCVVASPITGRIKDLSIETGSYINKGAQAMVLADDSILEIQISLSDKDAFELLNIDGIHEMNSSSNMKGATACKVESITGNITTTMTGFIHRIVQYDSDTRTLTLAVQIPQDKNSQINSPFQLMDGMFCRVDFKGKMIKNIVKIPGSLLNRDNTIYIDHNNRLKTLGVVKVMEDGDDIYVTGEFNSTDQIIISSLTNPIENQVLNMTTSGSEDLSTPLALNRGKQ